MMTTQLQIYLLGEFRFYRDGRQVTAKDWHTSQACRLFKLLLTERGHIVSARKLTETLWPEHAEHAHQTLRSAMSALRNVLEPGREPQTPSRFIPRGQAGYRLDLPANCTVWIDTVAFEHLLERAFIEPQRTIRQEHLAQALDLYAGDYLAEDEEAPWAIFERTRLRECYLKGATALMECFREEQCYDEAIQVGRRALTIDPSYEPLYRSMIQCQAAHGDTAGALYTFEQCRQFFADSLGSDPSPQTLALHIAVLRGDLQKQSSRQTHSPMPSKKASSSRKRKQQGDREVQQYVGRKSEMQWLTQHLERAKSSAVTNMVAVVGEAGVGKSFLLRLFLRHVQSRDMLPLSCTCHALDQNMAFAPLVAMLRHWLYDCQPEELAELPATTRARVYPLLPELSAGRSDGETVQALPSEHAYSLLVLGLIDVLLFVSRKHPLVLVLDDLQWADEATLLVLHRLLQLEPTTNKKGRGTLPLVVVSYRPEDSSENQPLNAFLRSAGRERRIETLHLARFTQEEVTEYLHLSHAAPPLSSATLYQATQGNALFLTEAVRTLLEQQEATNALAQAETVTNALLHSQQIRDVVLARVARLPQEALELLEVAALLGRPFPLALLQPLLKNDSKPFDLLLHRHFLIEVASNTDYDITVNFFHETVRQIIVTTCSSLRKRHVHALIAELLVNYYAAQREAYAAEIAFHHEQGGQKLLQALYFRVLAGDYARHIYSYRQAIVHYDAALSLLQHMMQAQSRQQELNSDEWSEKVYIGKMLAYEALSDWEGMQACHRYLLTHARMSTDRTLVETSIHRLAVTRSLMGHLLEAAQMGRSVVKRLQGEIQGLNAVPEKTRIRFDILLDITSRWLHLLLLEDENTASVKNEQHMRDASHFPPFFPALPSCIHNWYETKELLGATQAAFMFVEYGWALLLQGRQQDAEQCLLTALQAADETHQDVCWILASMLLGSVYSYYGQSDKAVIWLEQCLEHCQHHVEASWVSLWPQINQAYYALATQHAATAESLLHRLRTRFTQPQDFPAHRYSVDIGLGLVALEQGRLAQAQEMLSDVLHYQSSLNIETYVLAETGLASIARQQGHYDEAYQRYWKMLAFCGQRSLLHLYSTTALSFAQLLQEMQQTQGVAAFLEEVMHNTASAGYTDLTQQCCAFLEMLSGCEGLC
jgi:DNA-binding SARP family transcriptional activator